MDDLDEFLANFGTSVSHATALGIASARPLHSETFHRGYSSSNTESIGSTRVAEVPSSRLNLESLSESRSSVNG